MNVLCAHKNKIPTLFLTILSLMAIFIPISASAMTNDQEIELEFNLQPTINVSISGSLAIETLLPGEAAASTTGATVYVSTNYSGGYVLSATVGSSSNPTTSLVSSGITGAFSMLDSDAAAVALTALADDNWGLSINGGTTFIGLPLYTSTAKTLKTTSAAAASDTLSVKIGAKATSTTETGTYSNVINFVAVTNVPAGS